MGTLCGAVCDCRGHWEVPERATRALVASPVDHVLPAIARTAQALGLSATAWGIFLDVVDRRGGRGLERLFQRLARELTVAEIEAVRVLADPVEGPDLTGRLLTAPTLAVELARRGVTVEIGVLAEAELWSAYQPIVSLAERSVVAYEALLRGVVDGREVGGGDLFFVAESAGWLPRLDAVGRESAVVGAAAWLGEADLFVNVDPRSVYRPQVCLAGMEHAVHDTGIPPERLVVEIVESQVASDRGHLLSVLEHVRSLGWRVALDHVTAGWSSLSLLTTVRPDVVKLGKGLVRELPVEGARAVVRTVIEAAHRIGAVVVAEGVESEQLADQVTELGADLGQGWLFGRPEWREPQAEEPAGRFQPVVDVRRRSAQPVVGAMFTR